MERSDGRHRRRDRPRGRALAAPRLLRLLPLQHHVPVDPRRAAVGWARRAGDELGHVAGMHRAGDAGDGLDAGVARPARPVPLRQCDRWRRHPGHGERRHARRRPGRPLAGDGWTGEPRWRHDEACRLRDGAVPLERREGPAGRRHRHRPRAGRPSRRVIRHASRCTLNDDRRGSAGRTRSVLRVRVAWARPPRWRSIRPRRSPRCAVVPGCGCTSTRR